MLATQPVFQNKTLLFPRACFCVFSPVRDLQTYKEEQILDLGTTLEGEMRGSSPYLWVFLFTQPLMVPNPEM